jgi:polar amino acid transport system permease protein
MRLIVLPQAFRRAIPPLGNQFIIGLKDSSLVAFLGVSEIYSTAMTAAAANFKPFETYFVAGLYYLVLVLIFTALVRRLETNLTPDRRAAA